ncbi:GntR family transcriptional regulator [Conexibacter woesei]|uniref:Transcriptional regulator, GntR family n=1 Tax=Conexibacter woesei (strain DSM 14684 / CCUG 47730 / CIP 108061 / JCM 11494 / NBRC 100937 / ID131577) TaxID=469383 RepID=D3F8J3_CONWI|nr:GntR family transcriptional regulator [Conexibacter woesei]ADB50957.1 transcriptional regulator, GntR family [Conexibacter woesei DSM 14684]
MPVPHERDAVERQLLRDTAYAALCTAIVDGTLAPGEQLHDTELCAWLGLSRTPVRDALTRLADEGLVELAPQRYTRVAPVEPADVRDTFPVLAALHALATELAVPQLEGGDLELLQRENEAFLRALAAADGAGAYAADDRFHAVFVRVAGNAEVKRALARVTPRLHRLERLRGDALPGRRSVAQHQAILTRAGAGDAAGAAVAARANWLTLGALLAHEE